MAMQGMVMIEELTVHYSVVFQPDGSSKVRYTATDGPSGETESHVVDSAPFLDALACGMTFHGGVSFGVTSERYAELEAVMPQNPLLRFIP